MTTELSNLDSSGRDQPLSPRNNVSDAPEVPLIPESLPPVDRGRRAWTFCIAASVLEMLVWGYGFSFGIFQDWYTSHPPFQDQSPIAISAIGASALGIQYFEGLGFMALIQARPEWIRKIMWCCLGLCTAFLLLSSFSTKV
jgi:hypothetical protein